MSNDKLLKKIIRRANAAAARDDHAEAGRCYAEYLEHRPEDLQVLFNAGAACSHLMKHEKNPKTFHELLIKGMDYYTRAALSPQQDMETKANALNNAGLLALKVGATLQAKKSFAWALQLWPTHRAARVNFADTLVYDGEYDAADREFFAIINGDPNSASAQFSRSMIKLTMGDIKTGFMEYRARYLLDSFVSKMLDSDKPLWTGEPLDGKTLVFHHEQGWGDAMMFIRYAELVKAEYPTCRIIYHGPGPIHPMMRSAKGVDECVESEPPKSPVEFEHDYHAPLMHYPDIFRTSLETIPANIPYIVPREDWIPLPLEPTEKKKVAIVWAGSPIHGRDKFRSMTTDQFRRFIDAAPHCQFYSLQCGPRQHEGARLSNCIDLSTTIYDWTQTANVLLQVDLLISVDTAVAHLAGAMGVPLWLLLPVSPDWRWMLERPDSPWYPSARLFRQETREDWEPVIKRVIEELGRR